MKESLSPRISAITLTAGQPLTQLLDGLYGRLVLEQSNVELLLKLEAGSLCVGHLLRDVTAFLLGAVVGRRILRGGKR